MQNLTKSYMKTLKQDCKDLQELLLPADTVKFTEVIGEGIFSIYVHTYIYICTYIHMCIYIFMQ